VLTYLSTVTTWRNGSLLPIAKIDGSEGYKLAITSLIANDHDFFAFDSNTGGQGRVEAYHEQHLMSRQLLNNSTSLPLYQMVSALHSTARQYLDDYPLAEVGISVPFSDGWPPTWRSEILDRVLDQAGLTKRLATYSFALDAACRAYGIGDCSRGHICHEWGPSLEPERLVLVVDYSQSALSAALVKSLASAFDRRRWRSDPELGRRNAQQVKTNVTAYWQSVTALLSEVATLPSPARGDPKMISDLVLFGDRAGDAALHEVLRNILGEGIVVMDAKEREVEALDPLFAASSGSMWWVWVE